MGRNFFKKTLNNEIILNFDVSDGYDDSGGYDDGDDWHAQPFRPLASVLARHFALAMPQRFEHYAVAVDSADGACIAFAFVAAERSCNVKAVDVVDGATFAMAEWEYAVIESSKQCRQTQAVELK